MLKWIKDKGGNVPKDAVCAGWDAINSLPLYVGRARHSGAVYVGKVSKSNYCLYVPCGDKEIMYQDYEVLVNPSNRVHLEWEHCKDGEVAPNAVEGGKSPEGEASFIGRHSHKGDTLPGTIHATHGCLYVTYGGQSHKKTEYGCLVRK